jgi:hypothetical protein
MINEDEFNKDKKIENFYIKKITELKDNFTEPDKFENIEYSDKNEIKWATIDKLIEKITNPKLYGFFIFLFKMIICYTLFY